VEVVASLSQGRTAAAQCGLFTHKPVPVIFEPPCIYTYIHTHICVCVLKQFEMWCHEHSICADLFWKIHMDGREPEKWTRPSHSSTEEFFFPRKECVYDSTEVLRVHGINITNEKHKTICLRKNTIHTCYTEPTKKPDVFHFFFN